jgi:hypothetical protein
MKMAIYGRLWTEIPRGAAEASAPAWEYNGEAWALQAPAAPRGG